MKAKIITDTIYIYTYLRDGYNLKDKLKEFNQEHDENMIGKICVGGNGFARFSLELNGIELLKQFCTDNNVELIEAPILSVDIIRPAQYRNLLSYYK